VTGAAFSPWNGREVSSDLEGGEGGKAKEISAMARTCKEETHLGGSGQAGCDSVVTNGKERLRKRGTGLGTPANCCQCSKTGGEGRRFSALMSSKCRNNPLGRQVGPGAKGIRSFFHDRARSGRKFLLIPGMGEKEEASLYRSRTALRRAKKGRKEI